MKNKLPPRLTVLLLALFSFTVSALCGQPQQPRISPQVLDSLRAGLPSLEGEEKWAAYGRLERMYFAAGDPEEHCGFLRKYISDAAAEGNVPQEAKARMYLAISFYNYHEIDSLQAAMPLVKEFLGGHRLWDDYFYISQAEVMSYVSLGRMTQALACAENMYRTAEKQGHADGKALTMSMLGEVYHAMGRTDESIESYREAINILERKESVADWQSQVTAYNGLLSVMLAAGRNEEALEYCRRLEQKAVEYEKEAAAAGIIPASENAWLYLNLRYGTAFLNTGDYARAEEYLNKAARNPIAANPLVRAEILYQQAHLLDEQGRYKEAFAVLREMEAINRTMPSGASNSATTLDDLANMAYKAGEFRLAADYFKEMSSVRDSLRNAEYHARVDELRTVYEVDKLTAEKEKQRLVALWAVTGCILLGLVAGIYAVYSRRLRRRNLSLYRQIQEAVRAEKEAGKVMEMIPAEQLSREMKLFVELNRLMHSEKLFTDPALDRRTLAARLGTNEKYLSNAIREGADSAPSAYISDLRLAYSLELLAEQPAMTLDQVAMESGHGSYSSFFRAFVRKYGIGPSEYRKLSAAKEKQPE